MSAKCKQLIEWIDDMGLSQYSHCNRPSKMIFKFVNSYNGKNEEHHLCKTHFNSIKKRFDKQNFKYESIKL